MQSIRDDLVSARSLANRIRRCEVYTIEAPASAQGQLVWLTFDGVFRDAVVYLNGEKVKHHVEGYTSWTAYLHNASAPLKYGAGGRNVLAVFVDATQAELWCYVSP